MVEFFQSRMGHIFYEGTVPRMVRALERIADALEKANELEEADVCPVCGTMRSAHSKSSDGERD